MLPLNPITFLQHLEPTENLIDTVHGDTPEQNHSRGHLPPSSTAGNADNWVEPQCEMVAEIISDMRSEIWLLPAGAAGLNAPGGVILSFLCWFIMMV